MLAVCRLHAHTGSRKASVKNVPRAAGVTGRTKKDLVAARSVLRSFFTNRPVKVGVRPDRNGAVSPLESTSGDGTALKPTRYVSGPLIK